MNSALLYLFPFLSALLGWIISKIAVTIYVAKFFQKKQSVATAIGNYAASQFSIDALEQQLTSPASVEKILPFAEEHIDNFLRNKLPAAMPMLAMFISDKLVAEMKAIFMAELKELFPALILQYTSNAKKDLNIGGLITSRLSAVPNSTIKPFLQKQLQVVEITGACIGLLTGFLHIFLTWIA